MVKFFLSAFMAVILFTTCVYSDEAPSSNPIKPHQIYFGPEFVNISVNTHIKNVQIKGKKSFSGIRFGYEFKKPWAFYAGVDYLSMVTCQHYKASSEENIYSSKQDTIYGNIDLRFGYTTFPNQFFISPYMGLGVYALGSAPFNRGFHEEWAYWSMGVRSQFAINTAFSLGLNFKTFQSVFFFEQFKNHDLNVKTHSLSWGMDIGLPMIWKFNPTGTWTFQLEPYWTKLDLTQTQNVWGSKFLIGVYF